MAETIGLKIKDKIHFSAVGKRRKMSSSAAAALNRNVACLQDIEDFAHQVLPRNALDYYRSGADQMVTLKDNRRAFQK